MATSRVKIQLLGATQALRELKGIGRGLGDTATQERKAAEAREKTAKKLAEAQAREAKKAAAAAKRAADKLAEAQARAAEKGKRAQEKAAQAAALAQRRAAERVAQDAKRNADKQRREADRLTEHWRKLSQKSADHRIREEQRVTRQAAREAAKQARASEQSMRKREADARKTLRRMGGFIGGATAGVLAGGISAMGTARGISGVDDIGSRVQKANSFREAAIVLGGNVGMDPAKVQAMQDTVLASSMKNAKDPLEIMEGLQVGHERFNLLEPLVANIDAITEAAKSSMGTVPEFVGMLGSLTTAFGLSSDEMGEALNIVVGAAREGAIDPADFAASFAASAGIFATNTGQRGMEGVRQFVGASQAIGAGQFGGSESATRLERLVTDVGDADTMKKLKRIGVNPMVEGKIDMGSLIEQLAVNRKFRTSAQRQKIFTEVRALQGINQLIAQREKVEAGEAGAVDFASMSTLDASVGSAGTERIMGALEEAGTLDLQRQAIDMQKEVIDNLDAYNTQILAVTKATNKLEKAIGPSSMWARDVGLAGGSAALTGILGKMLGSGAGAGTGAAAGAVGGGVLATLGTSVGTLGAGAITGGIGIGGAVGGLVGYVINEITSGIRDDDQSLSDIIAGAFLDEIPRAKERGLGAPTIDGEIKVQVEVEDNRVHVKTLSRSRGARISVGSGPNMAGAQ